MNLIQTLNIMKDSKQVFWSSDCFSALKSPQGEMTFKLRLEGWTGFVKFSFCAFMFSSVKQG